MKDDIFIKQLWEIIRDKHSRTPNINEKLVIKWLGWLAYFLSLSREGRMKFAGNDDQVDRTIKQLTEDLDAIKRERDSSSNYQRIGTSR